MLAVYNIITTLCILLNIGALVASCVIFLRWIKKRYFTMSRSENIEAGIVWESEDPFGNSSGFEMNEGLREARQWLAKQFREGEGVCCPACGQRVQRYSRQIYNTMVQGLKFIAENPGTKSNKILRFQGGGDYAKLIHWGLLEKRDSDGSWQITPKGREFLRGNIMVPKYVYIYNSTVFGRSEEHVNVYQCADKGFVFEETLVVPEAAE